MTQLHLPQEFTSAVHATVSALLLGFSLVAMPLAYQRAWQLWRGDQALHHGLALPWLAAAIARWAIAPLWLTMVFIGYRMTETAIQLVPISHYGIGASALYHACFAFLPLDHRSMMLVNSVIGVFALPIHASLALELLQNKRQATIFAWLNALLPLLIQLDNSEANHVPTLWWLSAGLLLLVQHAKTQKLSTLAAALVPLTLAMISRPEMLLLAPILAFLTLRMTQPPPLQLNFLRHKPTLLLLWLAVLLLLPQILHVVSNDTALLPSPMALLGRMPLVLTQSNVLLHPTLFPLGLLLFATFAMWQKQVRPIGYMVIACLLAVAPDIDRGNMARVQAPAALFACMLAAAGLDVFWQHNKPKVRALGVGLFLISVSITALYLWRHTNEQTEESFIRQVQIQLPKGPYTLVRLGSDDRVPKLVGRESTTQLHFPDYLFAPPTGQARIVSISAWLERPDRSVAAYFYAGVRCYAHWRPDGVPAPHGSNEHPACARMRKDAKMVPILQTEVQNDGDVWLNHYGDAKTLKLGLFRVQ